MAQAPSCFLPNSRLQFAWDSTSLGLLKECPRKYYYTMIEQWRPIGESMHLKFGGWFHKALERFDWLRVKGISYDEATVQVVWDLLKETYGWETGDPNKNRDTLIRTVVWYLDEYREDQATTILVEGGKRPAVELSFRFETAYTSRLDVDGTPFLLSGHMDRLVEFGGNNYVMDRKTSKTTIGQYYFNRYDLDNQMSLYTLAGKVVYDTPVAGVIIDAAQTAVGFTRFARGITLRSQGQLEEWLNDYYEWMQTAEHYAERSHWPMNEKSCDHYGECPFKKVCKVDPQVRPQFLNTYFDHSDPWNPLEVR